MTEYRDPTPEEIKAAEAFMLEAGGDSKSFAEFSARIDWAMKKPGNEAVAETHQRMAQKLLSLFEDVHGRPARTVEEVRHWATSPEGRAAGSFDMLSPPDGDDNE